MSEETRRILNAKLDLLLCGQNLKKAVADIIFFMERTENIIATEILDENGGFQADKAVIFTEAELADATELLAQLQALLETKETFKAFNNVGE
ncbi:MAG: hypothetical protein GY928_13530 [Colwellia sp.]|nr:hypothetical protein [Colwellia sp.]